jgi:TolA-binding protein
LANGGGGVKPVFLVGALVALVALGCDVDPHTGARFQAERDLYKANFEYQKIAVRPELATEDMWRELAATYEAVADRGPVAPNAEGAELEAQSIAARALFTAAQIYMSVQDTTRADDIFAGMQRDYGDNPDVRAPVWMAQGAASERRGHFEEAADFYQSVVDEVEPTPNDPGVAGGVLELPLRIARLRSQGGDEAEWDAHYADAHAYYTNIVTNQPDTPLQLRSRSFLADLAADRGEWDEAAQQLTTAEAELRSMEEPTRDPAELRSQLAIVKQRSGGSPEEVEAILHSILEDYPESRLVPSTLLMLTEAAHRRGNIDEALGYIEIVRDEHSDNENIATREVTLRHPISEAALSAPLEIVRHYGRVNDEAARQDALARATREYREFIDRYPPGPHTLMARERLAMSLTLQEDFDGALSQMERIGETASGSLQGAMALVAAAGIAYNDLADTTRALAILDRVIESYPDVEVGEWATQEALRLRGTDTR